jgi:hypothetical protein
MDFNRRIPKRIRPIQHDSSIVRPMWPAFIINYNRFPV